MKIQALEIISFLYGTTSAINSVLYIGYYSKQSLIIQRYNSAILVNFQLSRTTQECVGMFSIQYGKILKACVMLKYSR